MNFFLKLIWRDRLLYWQEIILCSAFLTVIAFVNNKVYSPSLIWLIWCWILIDISGKFWQPEIEDGCIESWITEKNAKQIITKKWQVFLGFNCIIWVIVWHFWLLTTITKIPMLWFILVIIATITVISGLSIFVISMSFSLMRGNLLKLIVIPLLIPFLIYGSGFFWHIAHSEDPSHITAGLVALAIMVFFSLPSILEIIIINGIKSD